MVTSKPKLQSRVLQVKPNILNQWQRLPSKTSLAPWYLDD